jgi:hypothetical protein
MTYRRKVVLFPLRTNSVPRLTQLIKLRLRKRKGEVNRGIKVMQSEREPKCWGYVPVQIVNLSLEEIQLGKQMYVGVASPIKVDETQVFERYDINPVLRDRDATPGEYERYLREKLTHLKDKDRHILEPVLRRYKH